MNQLYDVEENHSRYANDTSSTMKNKGKGENTWHLTIKSAKADSENMEPTHTQNCSALCPN